MAREVDSDVLRAGRALLSTHVRVYADNSVRTAILTEYSLEDDSYDAVWLSAHTKKPQSLYGIHRYPYSARPGYVFQFVLPGENESVLLDIAEAAAEQHGTPE